MFRFCSTGHELVRRTNKNTGPALICINGKLRIRSKAVPCFFRSWKFALSYSLTFHQLPPSTWSCWSNCCDSPEDFFQKMSQTADCDMNALSARGYVSILLGTRGRSINHLSKGIAENQHGKIWSNHFAIRLHVI